MSDDQPIERIAPPIPVSSSSLRTTPIIQSLATALAKAQGGFKNPARDKTAKVKMKNGGEYSFAFADLASVFDAIRLPLSTNGLAIIQAPQIEYLNDTVALVTVTTRLMHASGEWIECDVTIGSEEQRAQVVASAITYAKRYGIQALLGVASEDEDDGAAASGMSGGYQRHQTPRPDVMREADTRPAPQPAAVKKPTAVIPETSHADEIKRLGERLKVIAGERFAKLLWNYYQKQPAICVQEMKTAITAIDTIRAKLPNDHAESLLIDCIDNGNDPTNAIAIVAALTNAAGPGIAPTVRAKA